MTVVERVKAHVPRPARDLVKRTVRAYGRLSAPVRPLPDFLVIGTKRGGTTSLWRYLLSHPSVLPMVPSAQHLKSPHYFYWHYHLGESWYRSHYPSAPYRRLRQRASGTANVTGEASPYYLYDPRVPARVAASMPDAKIIVLLRDPVNRAHSHYWERVDQGVEPLSFREALAAEPSRLRGELEAMEADPQYYSRAHDWYSYRDRGVYLPQLMRWFEHFRREQFLILLSEDFYRNPGRVMRGVTTFLGLPEAELRVDRQHNRRPAPPLEPDLLAELAEFYEQPNAELAALLRRDPGWQRRVEPSSSRG